MVAPDSQPATNAVMPLSGCPASIARDGPGPTAAAADSVSAIQS